MNRVELFQRVNQKFIYMSKPCVSGPKGLVQCSRASSQPAIIPMTPVLPNKLPAHPLGMAYVHWNFCPDNLEEWVNVRKLWPTHGKFSGEREGPQNWWDPFSVTERDSLGSALKPSLVNHVPHNSKKPHLPNKLSGGSSAVVALAPSQVQP